MFVILTPMTKPFIRFCGSSTPLNSMAGPGVIVFKRPSLAQKWVILLKEILTPMLIRTYLVNIPFFTQFFVALFLKFFGGISEKKSINCKFQLKSPWNWFHHFVPWFCEAGSLEPNHQFFQLFRSFWGVQRWGKKLAARCVSRTSSWSLQLLDEARRFSRFRFHDQIRCLEKNGEKKRGGGTFKRKWFLMKLPEMILKWAFLLLNLLILLIWSWKCNLDHSSGWVC